MGEVTTIRAPRARAAAAGRAAARAHPARRLRRGDAHAARRSVDPVFADPPYNLQLGGDLNRPDGSHVDAVTDTGTSSTALRSTTSSPANGSSEARRVLKPDGALWVIGSYHNIFRVGALMQDLGFWILNDVVWRKSNPMPNFRGTRFTNAHETLIWASMGEKARYHFNYRAMKTLNDELQMRSDWVIPLCGGQERLKQGGHKGPPDAEARGAALPRAAGDRPRPATWCSTRSSAPAPPARSPSGSGGSGSAASARRAIARRRSSDRAARCRSTRARSRRCRAAGRAQGRVRALVEAGYLRPGAELFDKQRRWTATVRADGSIMSGRESGSIHGVGKALQGAPSCNGWTFWHVEHEGRCSRSIRCGSSTCWRSRIEAALIQAPLTPSAEAALSSPATGKNGCAADALRPLAEKDTETCHAVA
jgi:modification methylase